MMRETQYNQSNEVGCSGVLNTCKNDCGHRKSSHLSWYKEKGQVSFDYDALLSSAIDDFIGHKRMPLRL